MFVEFPGFVGGFGGSFVENEDLEARKSFLPLSFFWLIEIAIIYTTLETDTGFHAKT